MALISERNKERHTAQNMEIDPPVPAKNMVIDINTTCNQNCVFCSFTCIRQSKQMDSKLVLKILNEAYEAGVREVGFSLSGEPMLNKDLCDYLRAAKGIGYEYTFLSTNGMERDIQKYKDMINAGLDSIKFSIHAADNIRYKQIHGVDNFDNVIRVVKELYEWRQQENKKFYLFAFCAETSFTIGHGKALQELLNNYTDEILLYTVMEGSYKTKGVKELLYTEKFYFDDFKIPCSFPFTSISITVDGYMTACCESYNQLAVADLNKMSVYDAWHSEEYKNFRKRMLNGELENLQCKLCAYNTDRDKIKPFNCNLGKEIDFNNFDVEARIKQRFNLI